MKKSMRIRLFAGICVAMLLFVACGDQKDEADRSIFCYGYVTNDSVALKNALTRDYDLDDLKTFFRGNNANENSAFNSSTSELSFSEVNQNFPIEVIRSDGYSVYRVVQGGYFYVFWIKPYSTNLDQTNHEPIVYFSAYLSSSRSSAIFDSLKPGESSAADVKRIDQFSELSFLRSSGTFSYSFLNDETILQIEYINQGELNGYDDLIVKEITVISRNDAPSSYSSILSMDLPD